MKDFTPIKIPQSERLEVNSREGKLLNKAFWAAIALLVKQINSMMERLLANINPNFPLWGRCEEHEIRIEDVGADTVDHVIRHKLGIVPTRWIVTDFRWETTPTGSLTQQIVASNTAWTKNHVFFRIATGSVASYKILLLP